jgi:integrase
MLTTTSIKNARAQSKEYFLKDTHGLRVAVQPSGSKIFQHRFRIKEDGKLKAKIRNGGHFAEISLQEARQWRDENNRLRKEGIIPPKVFDKFNHISSDVTTFKQVFDLWHEKMSQEWSDEYAIDTQQRADMYLLPSLGGKSIDSIKTKALVDLLLAVQDTGKLDTVKKIKGIVTRVFIYAVLMEVIEYSPASSIPTDLFIKKKEKHYAFLSTPKEIKWLFSMLKQSRGGIAVKTALNLAPHFFLRPSELVGLRWEEIDLDNRMIYIPSERMKMKLPHQVPLSNTTFEILSTLKSANLDSPFCFPSTRNNNIHITTNALLGSIRSLGIGGETFTTHGFRHMASTVLHELGYNMDVIDVQLAHKIKGVRGIYNHAKYIEPRKEMMEDWSNHLDKLQGNPPSTETSNMDGNIEKLKANIDRLTI